MGHNWPAPGGVDPLLQKENPLTPEMLRQIDSIRSYRFFKAAAVTKTAFEAADAAVLDIEHELVFNDPPPSVPTGIENNFYASRVRVVNDGPDTIEYSYDGVTVHGVLNALESATDDHRHERRVFLRLASGGASAGVRVWAW